MLNVVALVALRKESVDRNTWSTRTGASKWLVALRKESVDRNPDCTWDGVTRAEVALRKESVDRNINPHPF